MAYCRWSTDGFTCDIYAYESADYVIHVAGNRVVGLEPFTDPLPAPNADKSEFEAYAERYAAFMRAVSTAEREDIELPHAGETFNEPDLAAFKDRLLELRGLGYRFPDHVLDTIDAEMAAETP